MYAVCNNNNFIIGIYSDLDEAEYLCDFLLYECNLRKTLYIRKLTVLDLILNDITN